MQLQAKSSVNKASCSLCLNIISLPYCRAQQLLSNYKLERGPLQSVNLNSREWVRMSEWVSCPRGVSSPCQICWMTWRKQCQPACQTLIKEPPIWNNYVRNFPQLTFVARMVQSNHLGCLVQFHSLTMAKSYVTWCPVCSALLTSKVFLLLIYLRQRMRRFQWIGSLQFVAACGGHIMSSKTIAPSSLEPRDFFELATNALNRWLFS